MKPLFSRKLIVALALIFAVRLLLVSSQTIAAKGGAVHDDELFLRLANNLLAGDWLGPFDNRTLIKGPMYPLFIAANYLIGLPLPLLQHLVYLGAGLALIVALSRLVRNGPFLAALFAAYAFNPATVGGSAQRVAREGIYPALAVLVFAGLIGLLAASGERRVGGLRWALLLGFSFAAFWLTREEGVWLLPSALLLLVAALWLVVARARKERAAWWRCLYCAVPVAVFLASVLGVAALNQAKYGVFLTNEFREGAFPAAYGALSRVEHPDWKQYVPVPKAVRQAIYKESPAFRELEASLEGPLGQAWGQTGCQAYPKTCGDIAAGWFDWALRDAAAQAGYYASAEKAAAYWDRLAREVNQACREGRLVCGGERSSLDPPPRREYLDQLPARLLAAATHLTTFAGVSPNQATSSGAEESFPFYQAITRSRLGPTTKASAPSPKGSATITGWAYRPGAELSIRMEVAEGAAAPGVVKQQQAPDVVAFFGDQAAKNARFEATCAPPCTLAFAGGDRVLGRLKYLDKVPVVNVYDEALTVFVESVVFAPAAVDPLPAGTAPDAGKVAVLGRVQEYYRMATPFLSVLALVGYLLSACLLVVRRRGSALFVVNTALLGAVAARLLLLCWVDITSFSAINTLYLAPAYPLLMLSIGLALYDAVAQGWAAIAAHRSSPGALAFAVAGPAGVSEGASPAPDADRGAPAFARYEQAGAETAGATLDGGQDCELSIVMPCLNEAETLATCIEKARAYLARAGVAGEIIVADNGSSDGSQAIARSLGVRVVDVPERGYGAALSGGIAAARGRYIIMGDADDSYDFANLDLFVERLREGYDLVMGNRFAGGIEPGAMSRLHRLVGNPVLTGIGRLFFHSPCGDFHCGLRGFSKAAVERLDLRTTGMEFASEMVVKATLHKQRIAEVPTTLRKDGRSRPPHLRSWRDGWRHLRFLLLYSPRWLFLYPGLLLFVLGLLGMALTLPGPLTVGTVVFDVHTLMVSGTLILLGIQAITFAILAKQFGINEHLLSEDPRFSRILERVPLEKAVAAGLLLMLLGSAGIVGAFLIWEASGFGPLDYAHIMRIVIPGLTAISSGFQVVIAAFFLSTLNLPVRRR